MVLNYRTLPLSQTQTCHIMRRLSLPQSERAELAFQLLQSLDPPGQPTAAEEFGSELERRAEAYRNGSLESVSLDEARNEIRKRLGDGPNQ
jgi:putative addiction module component (TIGR02574 family)